ncbi:hypothetical protein ACFVS7_36120 [Streptomyces rubiginosohelvolus]|uniref:hypothetical protein n=1 Tax=Streptomyces rubiginosohelvolus TaxID=67362 RepID=UPI0036D8C92F
MDDGTGKPLAHDDQFAAHLGSSLRRVLFALALIAAPLALLGADLFTGPGWVGTLWICHGVGVALLIGTAFRIIVGPVGRRLSRPVPQVPVSPEVQAHQRRMDDH